MQLQYTGRDTTFKEMGGRTFYLYRQLWSLFIWNSLNCLKVILNIPSAYIDRWISPERRISLIILFFFVQLVSRGEYTLLVGNYFLRKRMFVISFNDIKCLRNVFQFQNILTFTLWKLPLYFEDTVFCWQFATCLCSVCNCKDCFLFERFQSWVFK